MHSPIRTIINYHYIKYFTRLKKCGPRPQSTVGLRVKKWKAGGDECICCCLYCLLFTVTLGYTGLPYTYTVYGIQIRVHIYVRYVLVIRTCTVYVRVSVHRSGRPDRTKDRNSSVRSGLKLSVRSATLVRGGKISDHHEVRECECLDRTDNVRVERKVVV